MVIQELSVPAKIVTNSQLSATIFIPDSTQIWQLYHINMNHYQFTIISSSQFTINYQSSDKYQNSQFTINYQSQFIKNIEQVEQISESNLKDKWQNKNDKELPKI